MNESHFENLAFSNGFTLNSSESKVRLMKWSIDESTNISNHFDDSNKRFSYCYLCSIGAHEHKKTEPVPINKRRYLKPYLNPIQLIKKYEKDKLDLEIKTKYKFIIKTGSGANSGTNASVMFKLFGEAGIWHQTELNPKNTSGIKFPSNSIVELELNGPILGQLKKLKIWHNGKSIRDGWYLDFVEIICYSQKQTWRFVCDQWISIHRPPNYSSMVTLTLNSIFNDKIKDMTEYFFIIKTSENGLIGKDVNVQFQFTGAKHQSQVFGLVTPYVNLFEQNQLDCFMISCSNDLGPPEKIRLAHNMRKLAHKWSIEFIKVFYSKQPDRIYTYKVDKWIEKNDRVNALISLYENVKIYHGKASENAKKNYHISVMTGNLKNAGTDSRVYIEIKGSKGVTKKHRLHNSKTKREFERGQIDHFHILDDDVGSLKMIKIGHDNSGRSPQWFLDAVLIRSVSTTITGDQSKQDTELYHHLDKLRKKLRIKELKPEELDILEQKIPRRAKSAELNRRPKIVATKRNRSTSANLKRQVYKYSKNTDKSSELNEASSTVSILKTSTTSPRTTRRAMMKKHVKFDKNLSQSKKAEQEKTEKIEMKMNWLLTINYTNNSQIKNLKTLENFDKSIKGIDNRLIGLYESKISKATQPVEQIASENNNKSDSIMDNLIHVFECNKWLDSDKENRKTEKILKLTTILNN